MKKLLYWAWFTLLLVCTISTIYAFVVNGNPVWITLIFSSIYLIHLHLNE